MKDKKTKDFQHVSCDLLRMALQCCGSQSELSRRSEIAQQTISYCIKSGQPMKKRYWKRLARVIKNECVRVMVWGAA